METAPKKPAHQGEFKNEDWAMLHMQHWRSWGSWFSWGSPIGLGLFFVLVCAGLYILHLAGIIG